MIRRPSQHALTIIQINDTHGYIEPHPELVWTDRGPTFPSLGGYARIATLLEAAKARNPGGVLALDNGDTFHGTYVAVHSKGMALVPLVNALGLDAMTAHWEFAWGPAHVKELVARLNHPLLAINCYYKETGSRPFPTSLVVEKAGLRIGIIGIAATIIDKSMPPQFSEGLRFSLGEAELPAEIARLKADEAADLIVVLSHLGFPQDVKLASNVTGIDVLLSGHTHNRLEHPVTVNGTIIIQSGCHGSFVSRLELLIEEKRIISVEHHLVPVDNGIGEDPAMARLVEQVMAPHRTLLGAKVGDTASPLHRATSLQAPMDDFLLEAIASAAGTEIAFSNGWRYGAPVPAGAVTANDLWNIIPGNPPVCVVDLSGLELRQMLEENLESTFSGDPYRQMGGYVKRCRGISVGIKIENPAGERIQDLFVAGEPVQPERIYRAAFVTMQGVPDRYGTGRRELDIRAIAAMESLLKSGPWLGSNHAVFKIV